MENALQEGHGTSPRIASGNVSSALVLCLEKRRTLSVRPSDLCLKLAVNWVLRIFLPCVVYTLLVLCRRNLGVVE